MTTIRKGILLAVVSLGVFQLLGMEEDIDSENIVQTTKKPDEVPSLFELCCNFVIDNDLLFEKNIKKLPLDVLRPLIKSLIEEKLYPIIENKHLVHSQVVQCKEHTDWIMSVHAINTQEGLRIISGSDDGTVRVWKIENNELVQVAQRNVRAGCVNSVYAIYTSENDLLVISGSDDGIVRVLKIENNALVQVAQCNVQTDWVSSVHAINTQEGLRIISGYNDGTVRVWKIENNELVQVAQCNEHDGWWINSVHAINTQEGLRIISGSHDGTVRVFKIENDELVRIAQRKEHADWIMSVYAINTQEGLRIISGHSDGVVRVWKIENDKLVRVAQCNGHDDWVNSVHAINTQEGLRIISGSHDGTVCMWDLSIFKKLDNITHKQAQEILNVLNTEQNKQSAYDKIKQIFNPKKQVVEQESVDA